MRADGSSFSTERSVEKPEPIHGTADPRLGTPTALERNGRLQRVVERNYRRALQIAWCERGIWRSAWDVVLEDGSRLTVYHDLTQGGWYELADAEIAELADEIEGWTAKLQSSDASYAAGNP